jgi:transposase
MLLDWERSQVIDLLPVRSADSLAQWLGLHPDVEMLTRDRYSLYADGGRQVAPSTVQITDRSPAVATSAAAGKSERVIMQQTGHRRVDTVRRYIRDGTLFSENAAKGLGL